MRCQSKTVQLRVFCHHIPVKTLKLAMQRTTHEDMWVFSISALDAEVQTCLLRHHKTNHSRLPANIRFELDDSIAHRFKKQSRPIAIPGSHNEVVTIFKETMVKVPLRIGGKAGSMLAGALCTV